ncbi:MAG: DUF4738 domain-containing protein [Prevotella sp.]|nr:DUF4738 domain-containing protein [Prevotella sp.]
MNRYSIIFLFVVLLAACSGQSGKDVTENKEAKAMLQGIWIDAESGDVSFRVDGDTIFYADSTSMPAYFRILGDSLVLGSGTSYAVAKQSPHLFWFVNANGDVVKLEKSDDPVDATEFTHDTPSVLSYTYQVKTDSVVMYNGNRYHWYIAINPTKYKVITRTYNDDGIEVENVYYDNIMHVSVFQGSRQLYSSDFRKQQYANQVPVQFLEEAILANMEFTHIDADGLHFAATLCQPDASSCYQVESLITPHGQMTMKLIEY